MPRVHVAAGTLVVALAAALVVMLWPRQPDPDPPPVIGAVPEFVLTDQEGRRFESGTALRGRPWVANFIFTRCTTVCPAFTGRMARIEAQTRGRAEGLRLVSFSVDPEHDTPEVLAAYAAQHGANTARWSFLTGQVADITRTVVDALKIAVERQPDRPVGESILHGSHFVLVDSAMNIRGYYALSDEDALERLLHDLALIE
jgi:protein SCO1